MQLFQTTGIKKMMKILIESGEPSRPAQTVTQKQTKEKA